MTHAYDKICLDRAAETLGRMIDYSVYSLHYDFSAMIDLFIASGIAALFERGDIRVTVGMSGIELAYEILEKSGITYERTLPRYTKGLSAEYWCGHTLAHIQWETGLSFDQIIKAFSVPAFISGYTDKRTAFIESLPFDTDENERSAKIREFGKSFSGDAVSRFIAAAVCSSGSSGALKEMRIRNGLSQSGLAGAAGIPVRTIQQYEQGQKDLSKANAAYVIALSHALNCDPSDLLIR